MAIANLLLGRRTPKNSTPGTESKPLTTVASPCIGQVEISVKSGSWWTAIFDFVTRTS